MCHLQRKRRSKVQGITGLGAPTRGVLNLPRDGRRRCRDRVAVGPHRNAEGLLLLSQEFEQFDTILLACFAILLRLWPGSVVRQEFLNNMIETWKHRVLIDEMGLQHVQEFVSIRTRKADAHEFVS